MSGVVFVNPSAGPDDGDDEIRTVFAGNDVIECAPKELHDQIRDALARKPDFIGIAGGDGSIRSGVEVLLATDPSIALLPIPAGTRNHFARELGVETIDDAVAAAQHGRTRVVDVGEVNEHRFVNNSSVGVYPRLVAYRERQEHLPKGVAAIAAAWQQLRFGRHLRLRIDGEHLTAWAVFVGNNCYGESLRDLAGRDELDAGVLDVRIAHADRRLSRLRIVGAVLFGQVKRSRLIERRQVAQVDLDFGDDVEVSVALDGEVLTLTSPLRFRSRPRALKVLVAADEHNPDVSGGRP